MRIGLIGCSKGKLPVAGAARNLYTGPFFRLSRDWIEPRVDAWAILSAKHGFVLPGDVVEPYDVTLHSFTREERAAWAARTQEQIVAKWGRTPIFMIAAGDCYREAVRGLPMVEDVFSSWAAERKARGLRNTGIGILKRELKRNRSFAA